MKTSIEWLKEYTHIPEDLQAWQQTMIMTGTAVESLEPLGAGLEGVVVGKVLTCLPHDNSDHLKVCTVDVGKEQPLSVVCGAPNVAVGQLVPTALEGARLPGGMVIKAGKIRGVQSHGMLCSATELNVPQELYPSVGEAGLLVLREDHPVGADIKPILGLHDAVVDVEVLANRPDCLSVWGLARESAAAHDTPFHLPATDFVQGEDAIHDHVKISSLNPELCPRYAGRVVKEVKIGPSPRWMQRYLHAAGMRPINNIVDITNFVMLETGHPMHAFDLNHVRGREIIVRKANPGEQLTTLDGKQHTLAGHELMICDAQGPVGLAGIMGGLDSEVTEDTKEILFECASFDRTNTRISARELGIRTEASSRFEKGVSPRTVMAALDRACHLVAALGAGEIVGGVIDLYPEPLAPVQVEGSVQRMASLSGVDIPGEEMVRLLKRLGFEAALQGDRITATAPDWRQDIEQEADLCEEVLRLAGYHRIPSTLLRGETTPGGDSPARRQRAALSRLLNGLGYDEIINFSFFGQKQLDSLGLPPEDEALQAVRIRNPLGEDTALMRTTLAPDMLKVLALNMNHGNDEARLYEFGALFSPMVLTQEGLPTERPFLCLGCYGDKQDFYTLRDAVVTLLRQQGVASDITARKEPYLHPGRCADITANGRLIAVLGQVHPAVAERYGMDTEAFIAEIDLEALSAASTPMPQVKDLPRTPAVNRDIALVLPEDQQLGPVMAAVRRAGGQVMEKVRLFDVYRGAQLGENMKSAAFALTLRVPDRTLTEEEINAVMDKVRRSVKAQFGAEVRS